MLTPDPHHDLYESLTVIGAQASLELRRLQRGNVDCVRLADVLAEITTGVHKAARQIEALNRGASEGSARGEVRIIVAD